MSSEDSVKVIAIDGPSASGKSTVSKRVAEELGIVYVDSGSLYRGTTWAAVQNNVDVTDAEAVIRMMDGLKWEFFLQGKAVTFKIDGTQPGADLRSEPVRERVSDIAAIPEIRTVIVDQLRDMVQFGSLAMEGRDIGTVVFPATPYKYYIDADPEVRARRRHKDLIASKEQCDVDRVLDSLKRRDHKDTSRATAPLQIALGATVVDSTDMSIDEVVAFIVNDVQRGKKAGSRG